MYVSLQLISFSTSVILCLYFFVQPSASLLNGYEAYLICVSARKDKEWEKHARRGKVFYSSQIHSKTSTLVSVTQTASVCLPNFLPVSLYVYLLVCLSIRLFLSLSVCLRKSKSVQSDKLCFCTPPPFPSPFPSLIPLPPPPSREMLV